MSTRRTICAVLAILLVTGEFIEGSNIPVCAEDLVKVPIDVSVQLIFAGQTPLFMRNKEWQMEALIKKLNKVAASSTWRSPATLLEIDGCPVVYYKYTYSAIFASQDQSTALDQALKSALQAHGEGSPLEILADRRLCAEELVKQFESVLSNVLRDVRTYRVLIYSPMFTSAEANYGYYATVDGRLGTMGVSSGKRFLFLDVNARPFAFGRNIDPTPGELMFTVSRNMTAYSNEMHNFLSNTITPPLQGDPSLLKKANVINFKTHIIDANSIIVQERLVKSQARDRHMEVNASGKQFVFSVFNHTRFEKLVNSVVKDNVFKNGYRVLFSQADVEVEDFLAMALSRAVRSTETEVIFSGPSLACDIFAWFSQSFQPAPDSVFTIPIFVFSFADISRDVRFEDDTQSYASQGNKTAIIVLENRANPRFSRRTDATLSTARKALEVLFSMRAETLALPGTVNNSFSRTVIDIAAQNYITGELRHSAASGIEKAISALNCTGFDNVAVSHLSVDFIQTRRKLLRRKLTALFRGCKHLISTLDKKQLRFRAAELLAASRDLSEKMIEVVCKKLIADDILRDVQAAKNLVSPSLFSLILLLVGLFGFAVGYRGFGEVMVHIFRREAAFELPQQAPATSTPEYSVGQWFSTLQMSKSKQS